MSQSSYMDVLQFWFEEIEPAQWWQVDDGFDQLIRDRFSDIHEQAARCELYRWRQQHQGRLAEIIVLDQFSRNIYRNTPQAFAADPLALALAQEAIMLETDAQLDEQQRSFLYLPFMHSESLTIHEVAEQLYRASGNPDNLDFELRHKEIIEQFGRYPHRNTILGRTSTPEEIEFLNKPGSSF